MKRVKLQSMTRRPRGGVAGAVTAILGSAALLATVPARSHTDSLGFIISPGSGTGLFNAEIFYGSWHGGGVAAEGALDLFFNSNLLGTQSFSIVSGYGNVANGVVPTGLTAGVNYFFADTSTPVTGDLTGDPTGHSVYAFQSATFFDITAGLYTFAYNSGSVLTVNWSTSDPAINAGTFSINANGTLGSIGGVTPSSNDIDTAQGSYDVSNLGGTLNPAFTGGTLLLTQDAQSYGQTFSLDASGTSTVDMAGNSNTFTGVFADASGQAGSIVFADSGTDGSVILAGANTHTGGTTVASGEVALAGAGTLGAATGMTTVAGGTLDLGGTAQIQDTVVQSGGLIEAGSLDVGTFRMTGGTLAADVNVTASTLIDLQQGTVLGEFDGTAALVKNGGGSLTLTTVNTYTGGTTVAAGALTGNASSFGSGPIINNAQLIIDQAADATFANTMDGTGVLIKSGTGSLDLTGSGSFSGIAAVAAGRLAVNGSFAAAQIAVEDGARLGGNGTVGAITAASGSIVAPGNSIGTLHVAGDYTAAAGSVYEVELDSTGASDRLAATGQAAMADGALLDVMKMDSLPYVLGTRYTVLTASAVTGRFTLTGDTAVSAFFTLVDNYSADTVWLDVAQTTNFAALAGSANQHATAQGLNSLSVGTPLFNAIGFLQSAAEAQAAYEGLSGEIHASLLTSVAGSGRLARMAASDRARMAADGIAAADGAALASNPQCPDTAAAQCPVVWMQAVGSWGSSDGNSNAGALDTSTGGLLIGTDTGIGGWRVGVLGGFTDTNFDVETRRSSGSDQAFHLGVYGSRQWGELGLRAGAIHAWNDVTTRRAAGFTGYTDTLHADYDIDSLQVFGEIGYRLDRGAVALEPFANLAFANLDTGAFTEHGGGAALHGDAGSFDTTTMTLGLRVAATVTLGGVEALTKLTAGWQHAAGDRTPAATLSFAGSDAFAVTGVAVAGDAANLELGTDFRVSPRGTISLAYAGQLASDTEDHGFKAGLNIAF